MKELYISPEVFKRYTGHDVTEFLPENINPKNDLDALIAKRSDLASLSQLKCDDYFHDGSMGHSSIDRYFYGISIDGTVLPPPKPAYSRSSNYAHSETIKEPGETLSQGWGDKIDGLKFVIEYSHNVDDWSGGTYRNDKDLIVHIINPIDSGKIRGRIEDALRKKTSNAQLLCIAGYLGIRID